MLRVLIVLITVLAATGRTAPSPGVVRASLPKVVSRVIPVQPIVTVDTVMVQVTVGVDGSVRQASVLRSVPRYDSECLSAARAWRFEPAVDLDSHRATEMRVAIPFYIRSVAQLSAPGD